MSVYSCETDAVFYRFITIMSEKDQDDINAILHTERVISNRCSFWVSAYVISDRLSVAFLKF